MSKNEKNDSKEKPAVIDKPTPLNAFPAEKPAVTDEKPADTPAAKPVEKTPAKVGHTSPEMIAVKTDPMVPIRFQNILDPGQTHTFNHGGVQFSLVDGMSYRIPKCVAELLTGIKQPKMEYVADGPAGAQVIQNGWSFRFGITPLTDQQVAQIKAEEVQSAPATANQQNREQQPIE